jgi:hypothetical protein
MSYPSEQENSLATARDELMLLQRGYQGLEAVTSAILLIEQTRLRLQRDRVEHEARELIMAWWPIREIVRRLARWMPPRQRQ